MLQMNNLTLDLQEQQNYRWLDFENLVETLGKLDCRRFDSL